MKMMVAFLVVVLAAMEGVTWWVYRTKDEPRILQETKQESVLASQLKPVSSEQKEEPVKEDTGEIPVSSIQSVSEGVITYPIITVEEKNGRTERTIHIGVRQYAWDPATITAKKGELVRLIIHNADVKHGLVIPDLGVDQDIPPDGAVVEFLASKVGTFEFFCSVWCGEGHVEMRGKIMIE